MHGVFHLAVTDRDVFIGLGMLLTIVAGVCALIKARSWLVRAGFLLSVVSICLGFAYFGWMPLFGGSHSAGTYFGCTVFLLGLMAFVVFAALEQQRRHLLKACAVLTRVCHHCGYDLTGNTTGRCPECGTLSPDARPQHTFGSDPRSAFAEFLYAMAVSRKINDDWARFAVTQYVDKELESIRRELIRLVLQRNPNASPVWQPEDCDLFRHWAQRLRKPAAL